MLGKIFFTNTLKDWGISLLIVICGIILCKIISLLNKRYIQKWAAKTTGRYDDILFKTLETPVLLGIMLFILWIAVHRLFLEEKIGEIISKSYNVLTTLNITWFFSRLISSIIDEYRRKKENTRQSNPSVILFFRKAVIIIIWSIGIITALNNIGVKITTLLSALGIGGLAFALASQDFLKNILGGFTLFTDQPFKIGERIKVDNFDGNVVSIGVRSTRIRLLDGRLVTIPNSKIVDASIENISDEPRRRVLMKIGLEYNTSPEQMNQALTILKELQFKVEGLSSKKVTAAFTDFADSALEITYIYYIHKASDIYEITNKMNMAILTKFNDAGLKFAFPSQTIYLKEI